MCWFSPFWAFLPFMCCCAHEAVEPQALPQPRSLCCIRFSLCFSPQGTSRGLRFILSEGIPHPVLIFVCSSILLHPFHSHSHHGGGQQGSTAVFSAPAPRYSHAPACWRTLLSRKITTELAAGPIRKFGRCTTNLHDSY